MIRRGRGRPRRRRRRMLEGHLISVRLVYDWCHLLKGNEYGSFFHIFSLMCFVRLQFHPFTTSEATRPLIPDPALHLPTGQVPDGGRGQTTVWSGANGCGRALHHHDADDENFPSSYFGHWVLAS
jgi:hypothetical protein